MDGEMTRSSVTDVAIIGAGPYGLSLAARLKQAGISLRILGRPMGMWLDLPKGMFLKSPPSATSLYIPQGRYDFVSYCQDRQLRAVEPAAMSQFAEYGIWAQEQVLPDIEKSDVTSLMADGALFNLTLANGKQVSARNVAVCVGINPFAVLPKVVSHLPIALASHSSQHSSFAPFAGKDVGVIGAGQSAFEAARLLRVAGARPQLLVRGSEIVFSTEASAQRNLWEKIRWPDSGLGSGITGFVLEQFPPLLHFVPCRWRVPFVQDSFGPKGAWWVRDSIVGKVPVVTDCTVVEAAESSGSVALQVDIRGQGRREMIFDHVIAATGFEIDVDRLEFIDPALRRGIRRVQKAPELDMHFQSSVDRLFFLGPASSMSFGPLFRFVVGAEYASKSLSRLLVRQLRTAERIPVSGGQLA